MITVHDVLMRDSFRTARLVAGQGGVNRPVHWVHVGEIPDLGQFLHGRELILATGLGLTTQSTRTHYLTGLIAAGAAGLVLELGTYLSEVPSDMIGLANQHALPIIVFHGPVRFLDLSQDINSLVMSQHHRIVDDLETLSLKIRQALLNTEGPQRLIALLAESLGRPTLYLPRDRSESVIIQGDFAGQLLPFDTVTLHPQLVPGSDGAVRQTVLVFERPIGDVVVQNPESAIDERVYLALDRTVAALAQDFIRTESLDRQRRREDAALLEHLLFDQEPASHQLQRFRSRYHVGPDHPYRILVAGHGAGDPLLRGVAATVTVVELQQTDRHIWVAIAPINTTVGLPAWLRAHTAGWIASSPVGISSPYADPADMPVALSEAVDAALASRYLGWSLGAYEELGLYRWILSTPRNLLNRLVIEPELGGLLDRDDSPRLLQTLTALLDHSDSKQAASQSLGIHRQTLYARIRTLSDVLGDDFLSPHRRLALGAALTAYHFLNQI